MSADDDYEAIHKALHTGQASAKKIDAQRALVRLGDMLDRIKRHGLITGTEADARALWAVRVLDAWAAARGQYGYKLERYRARYRIVLDDAALVAEAHEADSPDAARIAAATALVAADPSLDLGGGK